MNLIDRDELYSSSLLYCYNNFLGTKKESRRALFFRDLDRGYIEASYGHQFFGPQTAQPVSLASA